MQACVWLAHAVLGLVKDWHVLDAAEANVYMVCPWHCQYPAQRMALVERLTVLASVLPGQESLYMHAYVGWVSVKVICVTQWLEITRLAMMQPAAKQ